MLASISRALLGIGSTRKKLLLLVCDSVLLVLAVAAAYWLRTNVWYLPNPDILLTYPLAPLTAIPVFLIYSIYRYSIRHLGGRALWNLVQAISLAALLWALAIVWLQIDRVPRSVYIIYWLLALAGLIGLRYLGWWLTRNSEAVALERRIVKKRSLIYGAGSAGKLALQALENGGEFKVVGFIDDDAKMRGRLIDGVKVYRPNHQTIEKLRVSSVLLAMPSVRGARRRELIAQLEAWRVEVRSLPDLNQLASGKVSFSDILQVDITDLLGREPVPPDTGLLEALVRERKVLVSGAGGSIGGELARQILPLEPTALILADVNEHGLYQAQQRLQALAHPGQLHCWLGNLSSEPMSEQLIREQQPDTVFHAAAYKHVPLVEANPLRGFSNNLLSSYYLAASCARHGVANFILVSTDKAVEPTSVMGLSKRYAELAILSLQPGCASTRFNIVRFGNVLDSSGSVIPLFRQQIAAGGPITITDKRMSRYFMTIPEAASLVIQAGAMGTGGGEIFVLDMGEPVSIYELAQKMVHLSGLQVYDPRTRQGDIAIEEIGIRPGEKLHEQLSSGANFATTRHPKIHLLQEPGELWPQPEQRIQAITTMLEQGQLPETL